MSKSKELTEGLWLRLDPETKAMLKALAEPEHAPMSVVVRRLIREEAERRGVKG